MNPGGRFLFTAPAQPCTWPDALTGQAGVFSDPPPGGEKMRDPDKNSLLSLAIDPKTPDDGRRLADGLRRLTVDDPALRARIGAVPGQLVIGATSEHHLEVIVDRLTREFGVEAWVGRPEIVYREALTRAADGEMKYAGGRGEYAHVKIRLYPGEPGTGYHFENRVTGGAVPTQFVASVDDGLRDALGRGVLAGYPIDDVRVDLVDGSYHDVDSSAAAFRIAGSLAAQQAARNAGPVLLEPAMRVDVVIPADCADEVMRNLLDRRGAIQSRQTGVETHVIEAVVPLAGLFGYTTDLRSRTRGRGTCTMRFEAYVPVERPGGEDDGDSLVGVPRKPAPAPQDFRVALPEPDDDGSAG